MKNQREFPLDIKISFHKLIERYREGTSEISSSISKEYFEKILDYVAAFPKLSEDIEVVEELVEYKDVIKILLKDLFPDILSKNEIKAISIPFHDLVFNATEKFKCLLENAGQDFELKIANLDLELDYVYVCIKILNLYYGYDLSFSRFLYYEIPEENGINRQYRIDIDWEFMDIFPKEEFNHLNDEEVDLLLQNMEDVKLWKKMFPPKSWVFKGFIVITLTDVTIDRAVSDLKSALLESRTSTGEDFREFEEIFRAIFKIPDLHLGFSRFGASEFPERQQAGKCISGSFLDLELMEENRDRLCAKSFQALLKDHRYFAISNMTAYARATSNNALSQGFLEKGILSAIIFPIAKNGELLGVLELLSTEKHQLNSVNARKLDDIFPYIVTAVVRNKTEFENRIKAVIQSECTSIHPSVLWIFEREARKYIGGIEEDGMATFKDITFKEVYPLYGQIDIVASSEVRNEAIQKDFLHQFELLLEIIEAAEKFRQLPIYEQVKLRITEIESDLRNNLNASSEQAVFNFLNKEVEPLLRHLTKQVPGLKQQIREYCGQLDSKTGIIYDRRKDYDEAVQQSNMVMARYIDRKQVEAQRTFPHYFERYKTDGVEHSIYIGASMVPKKHRGFDDVFLYNIRLWQLCTMCEMENTFYQLQEDLRLPLEAASLILVYNSPISIRYRMDEKKFDVDGAYNARYEIIKKRIDKACVKGTEERITQQGKLCIVYSQRSDEKEYLRYIKYLQIKDYLGEKVELLELEDVQGVVGLKAIRVEVLYHYKNVEAQEKVITYEDLVKEL